MNEMSVVRSERGRRNRAYVRDLLRRRQPEFAAALARAEEHLSRGGVPGCRGGAHAACATCRLRGAAPGHGAGVMAGRN